MNIAFFLTPKQDVTWVPAQATIQQALELMQARRHSAVPLLDTDGRYVGTLTEGDLLWHLQHAPLPWRETANTTPVLAAARRMENQAVRIEAEIEALIARAIDQSFVPVVDDREIFVGIVRRQRIIEYCAARAGLISS
jgi:CBS-domain-containing membrane protein